MPHNLWIGRPGSLREIDQAAKSWDRSADLGVTEFRSLSGRATVVYAPRSVRRLKLSWESLDQGTAAYLDRLVRRVDGNGPLVVLDPVVANLLTADQSAGRALSRVAAGADPARPGQWYPVNGLLVESVNVPGAYAFQATVATATVSWKHPNWPGLPVVPGMAVTFALPTAFPAATSVAQVKFLNSAGNDLGSGALSSPGRTVNGTVPVGAVYAVPFGTPGAVGNHALAGACFTVGGDWASEEQPGEGYPAMAVIGYADTPAAKLPYRNISIDLLEAASTAG
ncbi:hypothetical protein [Kitasatospora sp. P5_F3]